MVRSVASTASVVITLRHVTKDYLRGGVVVSALRGVSLHVPPGEFCALMGPSGCGKSTLLNVVAGLDMPTSGDVILENRSSREFSDADWTRLRRELIGMVFQSFHLIPGLTAEENVALPLLLKGEHGKTVHGRVAESLGVVGLQHRARHRPSALSGGEQQRLAIARALVHRPRLILADEPTGNLDSQQGAEIIGLLKRLQRDFGQTILLVTHSQAAAQEADRRLVLRDGQLQPGPLDG